MVLMWNEQQRGLDRRDQRRVLKRVKSDAGFSAGVSRHNDQPERGLKAASSGAQVSLVTKGGSNDWHGLLYEYHRNTRDHGE